MSIFPSSSACQAEPPSRRFNWSNGQLCGALIGLVLALPSTPAAPALAGPDPAAVAPAAPASTQATAIAPVSAGAYAEPISPDTAKRFPHLAAYQGHILLGGSTLQVVLAGVFPSPPQSPWQPAVLATFEQRQGVWRRQTAISAIDLGNVPGDEQPAPAYHALAVDLGVGRDRHAAYATFIYGTEPLPSEGHKARGTENKPTGTRPTPQLVTWRLDDEGGNLALNFDDYRRAAPSTPGVLPPTLRWHLRLHAAGQSIVTPGYLAKVNGTDEVVLLGYRPVTVTAVDGVEEVAPTVQLPDRQRPPAEGVELLLTRQAATQAVPRAASLKDCLFGVRRPRKPLHDEAKLDWLVSCDAETPTATLHLSLDPTDAATGVPFSVFLFSGDGQPVNAASLVGNETVDLAVLPDTPYQLADTPYGRMLAASEALTLKAGERKEVRLQPRRLGLLRVTLDGDNGAALLTLARTDGAPVLLPNSDANIVEMGAGLFLVKHWPLEMRLPAASYQVAVARGRDGIFCQRVASLTADRRRVLSCDKPVLVTPANRLFNGLVFADLVLPYDLIKRAGSAELAGALGLDVMAREAGPSAPGDVLTAAALSLPTLTVEDPAERASLTFTPASPLLAARWNEIKKATAADVLAVFQRFLRSEGATGILELGCPAPGMSAFEYQQIARRLQVDALRVFGCASAALTTGSELQDLLTGLSSDKKRPPLLTAAAFPAPGLTIPRLAFVAPRNELSDPTQVVRAISDGLYSVSSGAAASLTSLKATGGAKGKDKKGKRTILMNAELVLSVGLASGTELKEVRFYSEKGLLKSVEPSPQAPGADSMSIALTNLAGAEWLRAELWGATNLGQSALIGATNFTSVASLRERGGESH